MTEHERIWLEPAGAPDRCWCQDNQWGDEGVEYVLASTLESLQRENEELRHRLDIGPCGEDAIDVAESAADHLRHRAEAAEAEVKRLRQFLFPYADRTDISGISWDGKYLIGDKASIRAFHEMKNRGEQIDTFKNAYEQSVSVFRARAEEAVTAANALQVRADTAEAEVVRLQAEIDRKSSMPGDHRYWEGRYRDEAAENEKLKAGIKRLSDEEELLAETTDGDMMSLVSLAAKLAEAEQLARTYEGEANQLRDVSISNRIRAEEAEAGEKKLRKTLEFYANPEIYKPHPHGPAFDRRDLSYHAVSALASTGGEHNAE